MRDKKETFITKRHTNFDEAVAEADRLSKKEGAVFFVLEAVGGFKPSQPPTEWFVAEEDDGDDEFPF